MRVKCIKDTIGFKEGETYTTCRDKSSYIFNKHQATVFWVEHPEYFQEVIEEKENMSPDFSSAIEIAKGIIKEIKDGTYHEENDYDHYIYEAVMEAIYGKDVWKLF